MGESGSAVRFEVQVGDQAIDVRVLGEIDIASVDDLRAMLWGQPAQPPTLRVDLSAVEVLSAAGVRVLIAVQLHRHTLGGHLVLANPNPTVRRALRAMRINRVIPVLRVSAPMADDAVRRPWPGAVPLARRPSAEPAAPGQPANPAT